MGQVAAYKGPRPTRLLAQPGRSRPRRNCPTIRRASSTGAARHRLKRIEGPERLVDEWWQDSVPTGQVEKAPSGRDYYRVEDEDGQRFWLYRDGPINTPAVAPASRWYVHGFCA